MSTPDPLPPQARTWIARGFGAIEDLTYIGLGLLLATIAIALLISSGVHMARHLMSSELIPHVIELLDRMLLTLLVVELLYTVQVSFREHALTPEPFLLVGLIAGIRRMLLLTAEYGELHEKTDAAVHGFVLELAALTALIVALVISLMLLRKTGSPVRAERA